MKQLVIYTKQSKIHKVCKEAVSLPYYIERLCDNTRSFFDGHSVTNAAMPFRAWHFKESWVQKRPNLGLPHFSNVKDEKVSFRILREVADVFIKADGYWCYFYEGELVLIHELSWRAILGMYVAMSSTMMGFNWRMLREQFIFEETEDKFKLWSAKCIDLDMSF